MGKKEKSPYKLKSKIASRIIYSRALLIALLILLQIVFYLLAFLRFNPFKEYLLAGSVGFGLIFMIYLVNSEGKNEFKLVWMLPVLIFPLFGIFLYLLSHKNLGSVTFSKRLKKVKSQARPFIQDLPEDEEAQKAYPKVRDIATYLKSDDYFPVYCENKVNYYPSGEEAFPHMLEELKKAKSFIFIDYFIIDEGQVWNQILDILKEKVKEGLEIRIIYDGLGSLRLSTRYYKKYLQSLGLKVRVYQPLIPLFDTAQNNRNHHKILDIDGRICFTGGINITDEYMNLDHHRFDYWKDNAISIEGSGVRSFTMIFLELWNSLDRIKNLDAGDFEQYMNLPYKKYQEKGAVIPYADDAFNKQDIAENVYNYIITKSHKYLHIMTPYLILDNTIANNLIFAAQRGVDVKIVIPGHYDHFITYCVGLRFMKLMIENGVKVYTYQPGFIHSKVMVSDDNRGTCGSVNLDYRSFYHHFECGIYMYQTPTVNSLENDFKEVLSNSQEISPEKFKKLWPFRRFVGWLFKIFAPLL
ncbi:MAG: cardiolipin synthase [Treponema sp.]|nr:cardiolipin synthase [Treponema sp.]